MAAVRVTDPDANPKLSAEGVEAPQADASGPQLDYDVRMAPHASAPAVSTVTELEVRQQLDRILNSKTFQQVQRLKRFVSFVVLETKDGRGDQLKEFVVGVQVFDKESSFDPRNDPIVRVQARRLRTRLATYYLEEGQNDEILIELPKGGYAAVFKKRGAAAARKPRALRFDSQKHRGGASVFRSQREPRSRLFLPGHQPGNYSHAGKSRGGSRGCARLVSVICPDNESAIFRSAPRAPV